MVSCVLLWVDEKTSEESGFGSDMIIVVFFLMAKYMIIVVSVWED